MALHGQGKATGTVAVTAVDPNSTGIQSGVPTVAGIVATVRVNGRSYSITTTDAEGPLSIRDRLVEVINAGEGDPM